MHRTSLALLACLSACTGCAVDIPGQPAGPGIPLASENPAVLPGVDRDLLWQHLVDVMDDYFTIDREEPVRQIDDVLTEGRIDTFPDIGSTYFEPWRRDSANGYEKLESTLQTIRRQATVRVIPTAGGYLVDLAVFKELEDVARPEHATAGAATLRHDTSLERVVQPIGDQPFVQGWIPLGRDVALEQRMLVQLRNRLGIPVQPCVPSTRPQPVF
jgi:hypothetical protein